MSTKNISYGPVYITDGPYAGRIGYYDDDEFECSEHIDWDDVVDDDAIEGVIPPKRAASKSRINTSPAFSAGRVSLLKPSYAFALE